MLQPSGDPRIGPGLSGWGLLAVASFALTLVIVALLLTVEAGRAPTDPAPTSTPNGALQGLAVAAYATAWR